MKKYSKILLSIVSLLIFTNNVFAATIKETVTKNDNYDTIEPNTTIIGVTKFTQNEVITASKATKAGANDATLYMKKHGTTDGYTSPTIYVYYGQAGGWYSLDENNKPKYIDDQKLTNKLSNLDIYYVNNKEKVIGVEYTGDEIDTTKLPSGVSYSNNQLQINSTLSFFDIYTKKNDKISYSFNDTLNTFEIDNSSCYTIKDGYITDYDSTCAKNVVIPSKIKNEKVIGIQNYAFYNKEITSVTIPETIMHIGNNAFANNNLNSVTINEKFDEEGFETYGTNVFGTFEKITYNNILTRAANEIPSEITVKISDKMNTDYGVPTPDLAGYECYKSKTLECYKNDMAFIQIKNMLTEKGYKDIDIGGINEDSQSIVINIDIDDEKSGWKRIEKIVKVNYEIIETKENPYTELYKEIKNTNDEYLVEDKRFNDSTNKKILNTLADKYKVNIDYGIGYFGSIVKNDEGNIHTEFTLPAILITKDNVLYGMFSEKSNATERYFVSKKEYNKNTLNIEEHIDIVLKDFIDTTNITNYKIIENKNGKKYTEKNDSEYYYFDGLGEYAIEIFDIDNEMTWYLLFNNYYEDKYDEFGFTKLECFTIENGIVNDYDENCGKNVIIPNTDELGEKITKINEHAFGYKNLKSVKLPENLEEIGYGAFYTNFQLSEIILPKTLKKIDDGSFYYTNLKEVEIPNTVEYIGDSAFGATNIKEIIIPQSVKEIADYAFYDTDIKEVIVPSTVEKIGEAAFDEDVKITFEDELLEISYKIPTHETLFVHKDTELNNSEEVNLDDNPAQYLVSYTERYLENMIKNLASKPYQEWQCKDLICDYYIEYEVKDIDEEYAYITYNVKLSKDKEFSEENTIEKEIEFSLHYLIGNSKDKELIENIIKNELQDEYVYQYSTEITQDTITTTDRKISELEEKYNIEILKYTLGGGSSCAPYNMEDTEQILTCDHLFTFLYFIKDDILYKISDAVDITNDTLTYYPTIELKDYESLDIYVDEVLKKFSEKTGITNYEIKLHDGNKYQLRDYLESSSGEKVELEEEFYYYNIDITDKTNNRNWSIKFKYHNFNQ